MIDILSSPPPCMEHPAAASQYQGNQQWSLCAPSSTLRQSPPHHQSPAGSRVPLSEQPSSSTSSSMLTPYFYDPEQAAHQDTGDYQQYVDNYNAQIHYAYHPGNQQPQGMLQIPYTEPHASHPSAPASMANPSVMQQPLPNQYQFAHYMTPAHQSQRDTYARSYTQASFVDPTQRSPREPRQTQRTSSARQPEYMPPAAPSFMQGQTDSLPAAYPQQFVPVHDAGMTNMQLHFPHQSPLPVVSNFTFEYAAPASDPVTGTGSAGYTPSSQHSGLPSPDTGDDHPQPQATSPNSAAPQRQRQPALIAPRPELQSTHTPTQAKRPGKKRARRNPPGDDESGSEDDDDAAGATVPPLKGPDGNAGRLCVFFIFYSACR